MKLSYKENNIEKVKNFLKALDLFTSSSEDRGVLQNILYRVVNDNIILVATNGSSLLEITMPLEFKYFIQRAIYDSNLFSVNTDNDFYFCPKYKRKKLKLYDTEVDTYPKYGNMIPNIADYTSPMDDVPILAIKLLEKVGKVYSLLNVKSITYRPHWKHKLSPCINTWSDYLEGGSTIHFIMLIMPLNGINDMLPLQYPPQYLLKC